MSPNIQKLRRSFVDGIAYICAYERGPRRVIAATLERTPRGITVWLATNKTIGEKVLGFLENVLSDIQRIAEPDDKENRQREGEQTLEHLTSRIVSFNAPRIQTHYEQVARKHVPACLDGRSRRASVPDLNRPLPACAESYTYQTRQLRRANLT